MKEGMPMGILSTFIVTQYEKMVLGIMLKTILYVYLFIKIEIHRLLYLISGSLEQ